MRTAPEAAARRAFSAARGALFSKLPMRALLAIAALVATAVPGVAGAADKAFDEGKFSFVFAHEPTWIPAVQAEGESVTFTLSEGEVHVAVQRDPNPRRHKTRDALAEDLLRTWKSRLPFDDLAKKETMLGSVPATLVSGTGRLYDAPVPYRLALFVVEKDSKLYVVKYSGLHDATLPYWDAFSRLVKSFRFRETGSIAARPLSTSTPAAAPTATPAETPAP